MSDRGLTHIDPLGRARMVDVTPKEATHRRALARCKVMMKPETTSMVASNSLTKGDVLAVARVAGIQAAKQTPNLIPLCHPLLVGSIFVNFTIGDDNVEVEAQVETIDRTGVEMEAMTACAVAACAEISSGSPVGPANPAELTRAARSCSSVRSFARLYSSHGPGCFETSFQCPTRIVRLGFGYTVFRIRSASIIVMVPVMLGAGIPLVQGFEIVGAGHDKPAMQKLILPELGHLLLELRK